MILMANQIDDMSDDPARGILEPEHASVESLGSAELLARPGATKRSERPASGGNAAKPVVGGKPSRVQANDRPAASEPPSKLDRTPVRARTAREAAAPDHAARTASPADANEPPGARPTVLRQGLPRTGTYRASAVTRSLHPTPVATPIVVVTPDVTTPVATPMLGEGIRDVAAADPRASEDAVPNAPDGSAEPASADMAVAESMSAATISAPPAEAQAAIAETAELPSVIVEGLPTTHADTAGAPIITATNTRAAIENSESESLPPVIVEISDTQIASAEATSTRPAEAASTWTTDAGSTARITRPRSMRVGLGLLGAAVLGGAILGAALGLSRNEARRDPPSALPAAANLVHAVSGPPAPAVEAAAPAPSAPPPAPSAPPSANAKPATPAPAAGAPPRPDSPTPARAGATSDPSSPVKSSATRETVRAAKPASPPRAAPAKPLTYDPDALFLPKP
jgi:hypothetical protein